MLMCFIFKMRSAWVFASSTILGIITLHKRWSRSRPCLPPPSRQVPVPSGCSLWAERRLWIYVQILSTKNYRSLYRYIPKYLDWAKVNLLWSEVYLKDNARIKRLLRGQLPYSKWYILNILDIGLVNNNPHEPKLWPLIEVKKNQNVNEKFNHRF